MLLGAPKMLNPPGTCWWVLLNRQDTTQLGTGTLASCENLLYLILAQLLTTPKLLDPLLAEVLLVEHIQPERLRASQTTQDLLSALER